MLLAALGHAQWGDKRVGYRLSLLICRFYIHGCGSIHVPWIHIVPDLAQPESSEGNQIWSPLESFLKPPEAAHVHLQASQWPSSV